MRIYPVHKGNKDGTMVLCSSLSQSLIDLSFVLVLSFLSIWEVCPHMGLMHVIAMMLLILIVDLSGGPLEL